MQKTWAEIQCSGIKESLSGRLHGKAERGREKPPASDPWDYMSVITQLLLSQIDLSHPWEIRARLGYGLYFGYSANSPNSLNSFWPLEQGDIRISCLKILATPGGSNKTAP